MARTVVIVLLFLTTPGLSQTAIDWETLTDVHFTDKYSEEVQAYFYYPHFGPSVKKLAGKEVILKGFMMPLGANGDFYVLSRNPYAACFFCGAAGPESIVELKMKPNHPRFSMDQVVTMKGTFKLNQDDIDQCNYIMEDAELYINVN